MAEDTSSQVLLIRTEQEAAAMLGISRRILQRWRAVGGGPAYVRVGNRRVGYMQAGLLSFAAARTFHSLNAERGEASESEKRP